MGMLTLIGCTTPTGERAPETSPAAPAQVTAPPTDGATASSLPFPERPPEPPRQLEPESNVTISSPETAKSTENEVGKVVAKTIIGESEAGVKALFGPPKDVIPKYPGHVWKYVSDVCDMEIFFYLDIAADTYRVLTLDISPETETENCYGSLASAKS